MLRQLHADLWTADSSYRLAGIPFGARMTIVRLPDGSLLLHSPIGLEPFHDDIAQLGTVKYIVAPNNHHYLHLDEAAKAFPDAAVFALPSVAAKVQPNSENLDDLPSWNGVLEHGRFGGSKFLVEEVFLHAPSRTLILTDLCFNLRVFPTPMAVLVAKSLDIYKRFGPSRILRLAIRDRDAASASLAQILQWDFERVIVAHGNIVESDGKAQLAQAYSFLKK
ncbi:MAG TPA: DUF4336 domain-containing protein [Abditibacteriaceae bacterium]|jgi:hypothetical protein